MGLAAVLALALLVRGGMLCVAGPSLHGDPDGYRQLAENLRRTGVYGWGDGSPDSRRAVRPTAFRPPLYPLVLAGLTGSDGLSAQAVGILHLALGVATVGLVYLLSRTWGMGRWAVLAAALVACDPILLNQSTLVMTETPATFLAVMALLCLTGFDRRPSAARATLAGAVLGLAALCRPTFLVWLVLAAAACLAQLAKGHRPAAQPRRLLNAGAMLVGALVVLSPWMARNCWQFGRLKATTTHGGYTLLLGNNPSFYRHLREADWGEIWDSQPLDAAWRLRRHSGDPYDELWDDLPTNPATVDDHATPISRTEFQDDHFAYRLAIRYIRQQPGMFGYACAVRMGRLWRLVPHQLSADEPPGRRMLRYATGVWYGAALVLAIAGIALQRGRLFAAPWLWGVLLCVSFTALHAGYWSDMRMRAPLMPFVYLLGVAGAAGLAHRRK